MAYVALPDVPLDPSSAREGELIRGGLPYLGPVLANGHWRVYAVRDATPLLEGPGRVTALGSEAFALYAEAPGRLLARVHYTRYDTVVAGSGCVASAPGGWTYVHGSRRGPLVVRRAVLVRSGAGAGWRLSLRSGRYGFGLVWGDGAGGCERIPHALIPSR